MMMFEVKSEALGGGVAEGDELGVAALGKQQNTAIVPEVHVAQFRMSVEPQPADHEGIEVPNKEVGEIEGAEFSFVPVLEHGGAGKELVAVRAGQTDRVRSFEGRVEKSTGATVRIPNEHTIELGRARVDDRPDPGGNLLRSVVERGWEVLHGELDHVGTELIEDDAQFAHEGTAGDDQNSLVSHWRHVAGLPMASARTSALSRP
jgi:hypothetical protein